MQLHPTGSTQVWRPAAGFGWGAVLGAASGVMAALVFVVVLFVWIVAIEGPAEVAGDAVIPVVIGPRMLEEDGWTVGFVVSMAVVAFAYGAIGWTAGRVFATKLRQTDWDAAASRSRQHELGFTRSD